MFGLQEFHWLWIGMIVVGAYLLYHLYVTGSAGAKPMGYPAP